MAIECMDGNFGQGRLNNRGQVNSSLFGAPRAVSTYWGTKEEVEKFVPVSTASNGNIKEDVGTYEKIDIQRINMSYIILVFSGRP